METEKTSYTLNHTGEEDEEHKAESYEPLDEDNVGSETDKMLKKTKDDKNSTEALNDADETTALEEKKEAIEEKQPAPNVSARNKFLQFFERKKNTNAGSNGESDTHNGSTPSQPATDLDGTTSSKRRFLPKLQNPFAKRNSSSPLPTPEKPLEKPAAEASCSDDKKGISKNFLHDLYFNVTLILIAADTTNEKKTETKFKSLPSIQFPKFSGIMNKFRRTPQSEDIELGNGPGGKAGLASMETLDDSTKDPWNQENSPDLVDAEKPKEGEVEKTVEKNEDKKSPFIASIQNYKCSIGES